MKKAVLNKTEYLFLLVWNHVGNDLKKSHYLLSIYTHYIYLFGESTVWLLKNKKKKKQYCGPC